MKKYIYIMAHIADKWQVVFDAKSNTRQDILAVDIVDVCDTYSRYELTTFLSDSDNRIDVERIFNM